MIDYDDRPWEAPGDQLYATSSAYRQELIKIKDDHPGDDEAAEYRCVCYGCRQPDCTIEGDHDHWRGGSDSMRWWPGQMEVINCLICGQDHGAVCPKRDHTGATRINFAGGRDFFEYEPYDVSLQPLPRARHEDVA